MNNIVANGILVKEDKKYPVKEGDGYSRKQLYKLSVSRRSSTVDTLLVLSDDDNLQEGPVTLTGKLHAEYIHNMGRSVPVVIFPTRVKPGENNGRSEAEFEGELKEKPKCRTTKSGLVIANVLVITEDGPIPVLLWGSSAKRAEEIYKAGDWVKVAGRLQSRTYPDKKKNIQTTYELSSKVFKLTSRPVMIE